MSKIIDCVTFFNENFIFDLRYKILEKFVDQFVVCESRYDHKGKKKKLNFEIQKYEKKKINIENYSLNNIWDNKDLKKKDHNNLNSFFWLFSLDLKSSKKNTQGIIQQWMDRYYKYNSKSWEVDILSKRIIAWISNTKLTYEDGTSQYQKSFNGVIKKQINYLINEIDRSEWVDDKLIGCSAIILAGLSYQDKDNYLNKGLDLSLIHI